MDPAVVQNIKARQMENYGSVHPTPDQLFADKGSWSKVADGLFSSYEPLNRYFGIDSDAPQ
jgi:hypothetical protein